jgi:hypothetical protein
MSSFVEGDSPPSLGSKGRGNLAQAKAPDITHIFFGVAFAPKHRSTSVPGRTLQQRLRPVGTHISSNALQSPKALANIGYPSGGKLTPPNPFMARISGGRMGHALAHSR